MFRRRITLIALTSVLVLFAACTNKKVKNPLANIDSKQPDKVLYDRAMDAMKHNRFDVARLTLQTLINTYPDSEFVARAKLSVADSWYAEGGTAGLAQAEIEYKDFMTFFPNMKEASEAQLKIANIHYQQMEKPDRDFTHAMRAEDEYRNLILQFPDSPLVPQAKERLLQVQEVLAEREFRIGKFYYTRQAFPAAIARLQTVIDRYPLYSGADETLYLLGQSYEGEIAMVRARGGVSEVAKGRMIEDFTKRAAEAYSKILTRYPVMDRALDAKERLEALGQKVPRPTKAAVAQNRKEQESRRERGTLATLMGVVSRHPDTSQAARVGSPTLQDQKAVNASDLVQEANRVAMGHAADGGDNSVAVETVNNNGAPPPSQDIPRSDALPAGNPPASGAADATPGGNELVPNVPQTQAADSNELKPNVDQSDVPAAAPAQVNEITNGTDQASSTKDNAQASPDDQQASDEDLYSSSKHKKKKGLRKIVPF